MKRKSILALTVLTLYSGVFNYTKAQDSTQTPLSFGKYLFKTPWLVGFGYSAVSNNGIIAPWDVDYKIKSHYNAERITYYPARLSVEKSLYTFRNWNFTKGFSLQAVFSNHGFQPINFLAADLNLKYDLNTLFGDTKFFDPYLSIGLGHTKIHYEYVRTPAVLGAPGIGDPTVGGTSNHSWKYATERAYARDRFLTVNAAVGCNLWINDVVGVNLDASAKWHWLERTVRNKSQQGANYTQYSIGVIFKIASCPKEEEAMEPVSTYQRSKEEEDAIIHIREHLNE